MRYPKRLMNRRRAAAYPKQTLQGAVSQYGPFLLLGLGGFFAFRALKGAKGVVEALSKSPNANQNSQTAKDFENVSNADPAKMTISLDKARLLADQLYQAMHQISFMSASDDGTDEQMIYDAFEQIISRDDMLAVFKAFGVRTYTNGWFTKRDLNLSTWLREELSDSEFSRVSPKLNLL